MRSQRGTLCDRWEFLLRAEAASSPLANPEILVYKIPETYDEVLNRMALSTGPSLVRMPEPDCACGLNPFIVFFSAGQRAMEEAMLRAIHTVPHLSIADQSHAMTELHQILGKLRAKEIEILCSVCLLRHEEPLVNSISRS